jgi:nucleotide-binding universal stress UspA family protein
MSRLTSRGGGMMVNPPGDAPMKILLPLDGSDAALDAVRFALRLAADGLRTEFVLANVQEPAHLYELLLARDVNTVDAVASASAEAGLHALAGGKALVEAAGAPYELEVASGDAAHALLDMVERFGCDLVVMGARSSTSLRSALLGSVSNEMLHACPVPVMLVRPAEAVDDENEPNPADEEGQSQG